MSRLEQHVYIEVEMARLYAEAGMPLPWLDVHLPHGWNLNQARVHVTALPTREPARHQEILSGAGPSSHRICKAIGVGFRNRKQKILINGPTYAKFYLE
jgi:hypothetical protein